MDNVIVKLQTTTYDVIKIALPKIRNQNDVIKIFRFPPFKILVALLFTTLINLQTGYL